MKSIPKKYMAGKRLLKGKAYAGFWIPDTPYSDYPPKIIFWIKSEKTYCRIVLDKVDEFLDFIKEISEFFAKEKEKDRWQAGIEEATKEKSGKNITKQKGLDKKTKIWYNRG